MPAIIPRVQLVGSINTRASIVGTICARGSITGYLNVPNVFGDAYDGPYSVTPKVEEQVLHTQHKQMTDDVTVKAIPVYRVSNNSGGTTVYIANEV